MDEAELDFHGYPTEATLEALRSWPIKDLEGAMLFIRPVFAACGRWERRGARYIVASGGWSGCECAISALRENFGWWAMNWETMRRGGYFEFSQWRARGVRRKVA